MHRAASALLFLVPLLACASTPQAPDAAGAPSVGASARERTVAEAEAVRPLLSEQVAPFLDAVAALPEPATVHLVCTPNNGPCRRAAADEEGAKAFDAEYFFTTKYGSPVSYARPLEVLTAAGLQLETPARVLDVGYGYLGHLTMLASLGHDVHGVEVDPILPALYAGHIGPQAGGGAIALHHGRLFVDEQLQPEALGTFDVILSKNVLKRGFIHPEVPGPDGSASIDLGLDDDTFVRLLFSRLNAGGLLLIYNLFPKQAPPGQKWMPWADGRVPFARDTFEAAGFEVIAYDQSDDARIRALARALGWDADMNVEELFALYTLVRRPDDRP
jgi:hypothetical protein